MRILHRLGRAIHRAGKLVRDSCAGQCCGACSRVYAFHACCLSAPIQTVYVCSDATCQGTPIASVFRIVIGSQCYSRAENSNSTATLPSMTLTDGADIDACDHGGCTSPECVDYCGNRFIPGEVCPGQNYAGPPVYVPALPGQVCGVLGVGSPRACFKFDPANTVPESQVPAGALIADGEGLQASHNPNPNCCACVPGCNETIQTVTECSGSGPVEVERRCCCTPRRDVTINFTSFVEYNPAISSILTRTIVGQALVQYDGNGIPYNVIGGQAQVTETYANGPDQVFFWNWSPTSVQAACVPVAPDPYLGAFRPFEWVLDCAYFNDDGGNTGRTVTNISRTCRNALHAGTWTLRRNAGIPNDPLSGQIIAQGKYSSTVGITFFGLCSGGCNNTAGRSGVIAARGSAGGCAGCGDKGTGGATI